MRSVTHKLVCVSVTGLLLCAALFSAPSQLAWAAAPGAGQVFEQRVIYRKAVNAITNGQRSAFREQRRALDADYILAPYLTYHDLNARLSAASPTEVVEFLESYTHLPVSDILRARWLKRLGAARQWSIFLQHFPSAWLGRDAELYCYYLRALYNTGERNSALEQTATAWIQPDSQPKACDPLFDVWRQTSHFNEEVAWQRMSLALAENEVTLARYLLRYFDTHAEAANAFYQVHVRPQRLTQTSAYRKDQFKYRQIVMHSLPRLARRKPAQAASLWSRYRDRMGFNDAEQQALDGRVALALAADGQFPEPEQRARYQSEQTVSQLAELAIKQQRWDELVYWIEQLPADVRQQNRWQYWLGRGLMEATGDTERARLTLVSLANERHYYGFWAAHRLGSAIQLNAAEVITARTRRLLQTQLQARVDYARGLELFAVGDELNGRREWFQALRASTPAEQQLAAEIALESGLLYLAISTANRAEANDALQLRFPIAFHDSFRQASLKTGLPSATLLAIARQESAMNPRARSHADARGLMQLLPGTARLVARRNRLTTPQNRDLYNPTINIELGSHHLAWLLGRYDNQLAIAAAAYNAGERRADRWIKDSQDMPLDVWIERIPFGETRNYVKNVLAFRQVYARRLGYELPFVTSDQIR